MADWKTEEDVKIRHVLPYLRAKGYKESMMDFEKAIVVQEGRKCKNIFADIVVYIDKAKEAPAVLVEVKGPDETLNRAAREQAISYARLLDRIAPFTMLSNGLQTQVFQTVTKERMADLPKLQDIGRDLVGHVIGADVQAALRREAKHELFVIDDVQTFKRVLKRCHDVIRNNEGYDPVQAFDEMSKILFCKMHEEAANAQHNRFRLDSFDRMMDDAKVNIVRVIFDETVRDHRYSDLFAGRSDICLSNRTIREIVSAFEGYDLSLTAFDVKGEAFEYFLSDTFTGGLGEYFTPRNVVEFIVDSIDPRIGERIIDPFCGTGGFLIYAFSLVSQKIRLQDFSDAERGRWQQDLSSRCLFGSDWKERTAQACKMNMIVHGDGHGGIFLHHGLTNLPGAIDEGAFDICLTNPPFGSEETDSQVLETYELGRGRQSQAREILALERAVRLVRPGGRIGIVVIHGLLNTSKTNYVRDYLLRTCDINAVIGLPENTFQGYNAGAKTAILLLTRRANGADSDGRRIFMAECGNAGYSPSGAEAPGNELPDILMHYREFIRNGDLETGSPMGFVVTEAAIADRLDPAYYVPAAQGKPTHALDQLAAIQHETLHTASDLAACYAELARAMEQAAALDSVSTSMTRVGELLREVRRPETPDRDTLYRMIGVRLYGNGAFVREEKRGAEIKATRVYQVEPNDIVYSRLFAWKGAFALLDNSFDSCYASSEFPVFLVQDSVRMDHDLIRKHLFFSLTNPDIWTRAQRLSTGSTTKSRNRLSKTDFLNLEIPFPATSEELERSTRVLEGIRVLAGQIATLQDEASDLLKDAWRSTVRIIS